MILDIPRDKSFPVDSVQCDGCGGLGLNCYFCDMRGWLTPASHRYGRRCLNPGCGKPLRPNHVAVYCSNECALTDR